jgi:hypothetical protein
VSDDDSDESSGEADDSSDGKRKSQTKEQHQVFYDALELHSWVMR